MITTRTPASTAHRFVIVGIGILTASTVASAAPGKPLNLRCEYLPFPLGIDATHPRLSWEVNDESRGAVQSAYQLLVSTDASFAGNDAIVWDSGKVESDRSIQVAYAGRPLASRTRYHWKVRTWDGAGDGSPWSEPGWWEMGLLSKGDWSARWITIDEQKAADPPMTWGDWIWNEKAQGDDQVAYFRAALAIQGAVENATVKITADNEMVLFVNGQKVGEDGNFSAVKKYDIARHLQAGTNILGVRVRNVDGPAGLLASCRVRLKDGGTIELRSSGKDWKTSTEEVEGWTQPNFDDARWSPAVVVGKYGDDPWGKLHEKSGPRRSQCMRTSFDIPRQVARARVYASGLGIYELSINGQRVGQDYFTPGWTHYLKRVQYQAYDVTDLLKEGSNGIGMMLGNGWWSGGVGWWVSADQVEHSHLRGLAQLEIDYADGSRATIVTDQTWRSHPSPVVRDTFYHGETYDARLDMAGWSTGGFDASGWTAVLALDDMRDLLVAQQAPTIRVTHELKPVVVSQPDKGVSIVDFGQNAAGWVKLRVTGPAGTDIKLRFGEELDPNGRLYRDNYRGAQATDHYILKGGGEEVWEPRFTYRGFRYCEVTGWPGEDKKPAPAEAFTYRVAHSAPPLTGKFKCSNWLLNQIYSNTRWGQRSNMHSVPTDCPQRDERLGWMGDAQAFGPTACWNMDMARFFGKWMHDVTDSQADDGHVTDVAPVTVEANAAAPGWGDAVVIVPWTVFRFYDDTRILEENYAGMKAWVEYMRAHSEGDLYEREGYGDWVAVVESPKKPIGSAYYYYSTKLLAETASVLGRKDDAEEYTALAGRIRDAFNKKHLDKNSNYPGATQTANILPLYFGIVPEDREPAVLANLVNDIKERGYHLSTGFMGTTYLMVLLGERGLVDPAWQLAVQTTYPSWGYMIRQGATTIWERWDTDKRGPSMNSRNHFAFGTVVQWFYEHLAGIQVDPAHPGFKRFFLRPTPAGDLQWVRCSFESMHGGIVSNWHRTERGLTLQVHIPANTSAELTIPRMNLRPLNGVLLDGKVLFDKAAATRAGNGEGVAFLRMDNGFPVFDVKAGRYRFEIVYGD